MLAYVFWHRPAAGVRAASYERALARFHASLTRRPPSGLAATAALRAGELPWLAGGGTPGYEDWYVVESWSALGVLERAAVSRGHETAHREAARRSADGAGAVYKRLEGELEPRLARLAVWVDTPRGQSDPTMAELLGDGFEPHRGVLWQRALVLGPAPEFCLLLDEPSPAAASGVAPTRLPAGWCAAAFAREAVTA